MDNSTSAQYTETSMEYMKFCAYVVDKEMQRFNLDFTVYKSFVTQLPGVLDVNFDIAYNRCAFMYKYTLCNIYFFKDCMNKFIMECPEFKNLVSKWVADSNIRLCSLSCGAGLDYLSFMLALSDLLTPPSFKTVTILSKHGAWRNTVSIVADALQEGVLSKCGIGKMGDFKNIEVIQTDLLVFISAKGLEALQKSSVILMVKTLNLTAPAINEEFIKAKLLDLISSLKPETTIFFIDTKPSLTLLLEVLLKFDGNFLFKPEHLSFRVPVTFSEEYKERNGCLPVVSSRGAFFVWQKLSSCEPDPNFNISPSNPLPDVKEISQNSLEKSLNENDEILNITKNLKDLILLNNTNLHPNSVDDVVSNLHISVSDIREAVSAMSSFVITHKQLENNKSVSSQNLVTAQSVQELPLVNFDEKSCPSHYLRKSSSVDNSFFQGSSTSISFLGESDLQHNSLSSSTIEENPQHNVTKKKSESKEKINVPQNNQAVKPTSESKATQTELHQPVPNSSLVKGLTERIKRLVSSLENEVQKNMPRGQVNCHLLESPNRSTIYSSCSKNCSNDSDADKKQKCCNACQTEKENPIGHCDACQTEKENPVSHCDACQTEKENPISHCNYVQMNHAHCCAARHMVHRCEMQCCQSCIHRCSWNPSRNFCESKVASSSTSLAQLQIVIPLQNVGNDILSQIISAAISGSKP